ncbi:ABC transporter permease [Paenibacillus sp. GCM10023252]|uniref:ABC transporter permease n=1 Tax=Paenibacillus sp. GCM10023252 TaxID=3252649 RepID=UPI0036216511
MTTNQSAAKSVSGGWRSKLINPVLDKEFRLRMRTPRSMWTILAYLFAIGLMGLSAIYLTQVNYGGTQAFNPEQSKMLFIMLSLAQLGLIAFMAPGLTAGVISGEREKQTLSLLLTTQQSSATIILSKLLSSLSFMILIVVSTIPVYSMIFLYGGVSPKQLLLVFMFYIVTMIVLGSFGILFSTLFKKTMISVIVTYGVTLFLFAGTALVYVVVMQVVARVSTPPYSFPWIGHIMALNPAAALYSILEPSITEEIFSSSISNVQGKYAPMALWQEWILIFSVVSAGVLWLSIRRLRPRA